MSFSKIKRCCACAGSLIASLASSFPGAAQTPDAGADLAATMQRLSIKLPPQVADSDAVKRPLEELGRERCDQSAIGNLGTALEKAGYRREAAVAQVTFSQSCGGHGASLRAEIGRASCREGVEASDGAVLFKQKTAYEMPK